MHQEVLVVPMILMTFVENAFKHGALVNGFMSAIISLKCNAPKLEFLVKNKVKESCQLTAGHGAGLDNTKKGLDATFPARYILALDENENLYSIKLTVKF